MSLRFWLLVCVTGMLNRAECGLIELYSGNGLPANESWLAYGNDSLITGGSATQTGVAGGVQLQTDLAVSAGYSNYQPGFSLKNGTYPSLKRADGFALDFRLQVLSENHVSNDRAGFSVTFLDEDHRGIELGFWTDEIWAQADTPLFQRAESASVSTTAVHDYRLEVLGAGYTLFQSGNSILTGSLRNYEAFSGPVDPYELPNFLYMGDNTSSAEANVILGPIYLTTTLASVPEPTVAGPPAIGLILSTCAVRRRRRNSCGSGRSV